MSRKPLGPINCNSDMRLGVVKAEHDVLDLVEGAAPAWGQFDTEFLLRKAEDAACAVLDERPANGDRRRQKAVKAAAVMISAIIAMDAGR